VRLAAGRLSWAGPFGVLAARTLLVILAQAGVALFFRSQGSPNPLLASASWWPVTGTLVDLGCLALLACLTRLEGVGLRDLVGLRKDRLVRDILLGLGFLVILFPVVMIGGSLLTGRLVYGTFQPELPGVLLAKPLPWWAALYSRMIWWVIWSAVEEMTYNGYALPRLQALTGGRTWLAVMLVGFAWAVQHAFLPFLFDLKVFLFLFLQMLPLVTAMQLLYLRFRRLPPLIILHGGMDLFSTLFMISVI
jgi:hypothetical protein